MKSILQLAQLFRDFLDGNSMIPTYAEPLFGLLGDTKEQLSTIKKLNDLSFLTLDSQDGLEELSDKGVTTYQRAYIFGFMPTIIAELLKQDLALSDVLFSTVPIKKGKFLCEIVADVENKQAENEDENQGRFRDGILEIPLTIEKMPDGTQRFYTNYPMYVNCQDLNTLSIFLEIEKNNPKLKEIFINDYSFVNCVDTVWKRPKYLANVLVSRLEKVIKTLAVKWEESCSIFTPFDNDKLIQTIKTTYPELKTEGIEKLTKTELCLILTLQEVRSKFILDGIPGLKQIEKDFKSDNKQEVDIWMKRYLRKKQRYFEKKTEKFLFDYINKLKNQSSKDKLLDEWEDIIERVVKLDGLSDENKQKHIENFITQEYNKLL
jgi:hypothetical protein